MVTASYRGSRQQVAGVLEVIDSRVYRPKSFVPLAFRNSTSMTASLFLLRVVTVVKIFPLLRRRQRCRRLRAVPSRVYDSGRKPLGRGARQSLGS